MKQTLELSLELSLNRNFKKAEYTVGVMYINGDWFSETLEDTVRILGKNGEGKIYGKTAIGAGRYRVVMQMSPKFKRRMPYLLNVPFFSRIMIHSLTTAEQSLGCIGVGENKMKGKLLNSREYSDRLNVIIEKAITEGKEVWITIE